MSKSITIFHIKAILLFINLTTTNCFSQNKNDSLISIIKNAEKVILVSHQDYRQQIMRKPKKGEPLYKSKHFRNKVIPVDVYFELLTNNEPNYEIIQEKISLDSITKNELITILSNQTNENYDGNSCFDPHHTIFIQINKKWEFIDICFGCDKFSFSKGLNINDKTLLNSFNDWRILQDFFKKLNLTYRLPKIKN